MKLRLFGTLSVILALAVVGFAATVSHAAPSRQEGVVFLPHPTEIAGVIAMGSILIVHDEAKMDRGEPCTTIYELNPGKAPAKELVTFACKPLQREAVKKLTATCEQQINYSSTRIDRLTEFQFAGDKEAHAVPVY